MSRTRLLVAASAAYLLALLAGAPAERLRGPLESMLPNVVLGALHGHPLAGHADGARLGDLTIDRLTWRWRALPLLQGRFGLAVELATGPTRVELDLATTPSGEFFVEHLSGELDLAWLGRALTAPGFRASGRLTAEEITLSGDGGWPRTAEGSLRLENGRVDAPIDFPVGAADGVLQSRDGWIELAFTLDPGGPLTGDGRLRFASDRRYALAAHLAPGPQAGSTTRDLLRLLGPAQANGAVDVAQQGNLR